MANLPPTRQISIQQIPGAPSWLGALLTPLNSILGAQYDALNGGLTAPQNLGNQQLIDVQCSMGATWQAASFKYTTKGKPRFVQIGNITGPPPVGAVTVNAWHIGNGTISLDSVVGLAPGSYTLTILVVA